MAAQLYITMLLAAATEGMPQWLVTLIFSTAALIVGSLLTYLVKLREVDATAHLGSAELQLKESGDMRREYGARLEAVERRMSEREADFQRRIGELETSLAKVQADNLKLQMDVGTARLAIARSEGERKIVYVRLREIQYGTDDLQERIANGSVSVDRDFVTTLTTVRAHLRHVLVDVLYDVTQHEADRDHAAAAGDESAA